MNNKSSELEMSIIDLANTSLKFIRKNNPAVCQTLSFIANDEASESRILALLTILIAEQIKHEKQLKDMLAVVKYLNDAVYGD